MTIELGNAFYQDCNTFDNSILPRNVKPLTYLAKISKAPFSIAKGPDVTNLTTTLNGNTLTIAVSASDSALSYASVRTSEQGVGEIRVFINTHPYSLPTISTNTGYLATDGIVTVDISLLSNASRHVVYVQATDNAGYRGPVTAAYFQKDRNQV